MDSNANKISDTTYLKAKFIIVMVVTIIIEDVGRTVATPSNFGTTWKGMCTSRANHWTTRKVDTIELCDDYGIIIS